MADCIFCGHENAELVLDYEEPCCLSCWEGYNLWETTSHVAEVA